jgi:hypothetical protein
LIIRIDPIVTLRIRGECFCDCVDLKPAEWHPCGWE